MDALLKDIQFAIRSLRKHSAFSIVAIVTIALGIGANTAIFSVTNAVLFTDLPYENADELVQVWSTNEERGVERGLMSPPDIADFQAQNRTLIDMAAYSEAELAMIDDDGSALKVTGTWAGDNLFEVLGASPLLGRTLRDGDGADGAPKVMVLGHGFWQSRLGADPNVIGTSITVEDVAHVVVGVMPAGFDFPGNSSFWLNRYLLSYPGRYARWMDVVGRLQPGVTVEVARTDFMGVARRLEEEHPGINRAYRTQLLSLQEAVVGDARGALLILLGATGFLLLMACVNVTNLLLARMKDRSREVAVRMAMGAGHKRLARQMLTEGFVLAASGAVLGTLLASVGINALVALGPENLPRLAEVRMDGTVLLFTFLSTALTGLIFGLVPVFRLARGNVHEELKEGGRGGSSGSLKVRSRGLLVVAQMALAIVLVVGASLLARSFDRLASTDPGFDAAGVITLQVDVPTASYQEYPRVADYYRDVTRRLSDLAGVRSVAATATLPFASEVPFLGNFVVEDRVAPREGEEPRAHFRQITPGFFRTMGIEVSSGREFNTQDDRESRGVAMVNAALVNRAFPGEDPIGKTISGLPPHIALGAFLVESFEIVGVVEDVKYFGLDEPSEPSLYLPVAQAPFRRMNFTLASDRNLPDLIRDVRRELRAVDPTVPISRVRTMERILSDSVARERFSMTLLSLFGAVALVLATVGIYGVTSYSVSQRTTELGIRLTVGATPDDVMRLVMLQSAKLTGTGVALGLLAAAALSRVMTNQLFGIDALDLTTFVGVAGVLSLVAMMATFIPARRAARTDPALVLQGND